MGILKSLGIVALALAGYLAYLLIASGYSTEAKIFIGIWAAAFLYTGLIALISKSYKSFKKNLFSLSAWPF